MFKLLKGGHCYCPEDKGIKDILVVAGKIYKLEENISPDIFPDIKVIDCAEKIVCPGFIDQHVHITGGGGEEGPESRIPELMLTDITTAGVTTLVGVLGVDGVTRSIADLLTKARALQAEGINTYIYTGSYSVPTVTLTGHVISDMTLIDKVIGVGEIAIADYRSSHPTIQMLRELASEVSIGGLLGGKAGVMHIHVGDGKDGLTTLFRLLEEVNFPINMFVPTHLNRNKELLAQATEYALKGGNIDLTAGEKTGKGLSVPDALQKLKGSNVDMDKITVSSDGNGSIPSEDGSSTGVGKVSQLFDDIRDSVVTNKLDLEQALKLVTSNVSKVLKIYPQKGVIKIGSDADIMTLSLDFVLDKLLINGELFIDNGVPVRKGRYEKAYERTH
jgi:beta-aspartyl-dipeptidase (metallo-type)